MNVIGQFRPLHRDGPRWRQRLAGQPGRLRSCPPPAVRMPLRRREPNRTTGPTNQLRRRGVALAVGFVVPPRSSGALGLLARSHRCRVICRSRPSSPALDRSWAQGAADRTLRSVGGKPRGDHCHTGRRSGPQAPPPDPARRASRRPAAPLPWPEPLSRATVCRVTSGEPAPHRGRRERCTGSPGTLWWMSACGRPLLRSPQADPAHPVSRLGVKVTGVLPPVTAARGGRADAAESRELPSRGDAARRQPRRHRDSAAAGTLPRHADRSTLKARDEGCSFVGQRDGPPEPPGTWPTPGRSTARPAAPPPPPTPPPLVSWSWSSRTGGMHRTAGSTTIGARRSVHEGHSRWPRPPDRCGTTIRVRGFRA